MNQSEFNKKTHDTDLFTIQDVLNDNACLYRAVANTLYFGSPYKTNKLIFSMKNWGQTKLITEVNEVYGNFSEKQDKLARELQKKILHFVETNKDTQIPILGNISLDIGIQMIHGLDWYQYLKFYKTFAGDVSNDEKIQELDNEIFIDRWGSIIEQWIISELFKRSLFSSL